jgi:anti-sigma28 factor (negative regulator of flagellin synthesis)
MMCDTRHNLRKCFYSSLNQCSLGSDIKSMIISDEQAREVAEHLRQRQGFSVAQAHRDIDPEVLKRAMQAAFSAPDIRDDRVAAAREHLRSGTFDPETLADKLLSRMMGDSLR